MSEGPRRGLEVLQMLIIIVGLDGLTQNTSSRGDLTDIATTLSFPSH